MTTTLPPESPGTLAADLRAATHAAHERAEHSTFMADLVEGRLSLAAWLALLEQLQPVYAALESVAPRFRSHPELGGLFHPGLDRSAGIASDLAVLRERLGTPGIGVLPTARRYAERIAQCSDDVARFAAHHYTRYLGDLSGGRIMLVRFREHYALPADAEQFFSFPDIGAPVPFKRAYRATLDGWNADATTTARLTDEACAAFLANEEVFAELDRRDLPRAVSR